MTTDPPSLSVGQRLIQGREARGLTIQQVALQLNLKVEVVQKLEQDQLEGTLDTFVRGYIRAYARLLKLPEQELLTAHGQQSGVQSGKAKPMRTFSNRTGRQATENRFMWLTYAIVILLLLMLFIWWWQSERQTDAVSKVVDTPALMSQTPVDTGVENADDVQPAEQTADLAAADNAEAEQPSVEQLNAMLQQLAEQDSAAAPIAEEIPPPAMDQLEMRFSDNCWVDVVDALGNRVAYGTKQAGYIMQLSGKAPFVVTLGNPSVVSISFNQQAVDMSSYPGGRVAKFSIPESE